MDIDCVRFFSSSTRVRTSHGFTLVELLVVVLLISLLAGTAAMSVEVARYAEAQLQQAISQIRSLDSAARQRSRTASSLRLEFDLQSQRRRLLDGRDKDVAPAVSVLSPHRIVAVMPWHSETGVINAIEYDRFGTTDTYAVCISSKSGKQSQLLILESSTGQSYVLEDQERTRAITNR